jgi:hypothetical protein
MRRLNILIFAFLIAVPAFGQGLTINMTATDASGKKSPQIFLADRTRARLDLYNGGKIHYDSETKKLLAMLPGATVFVELTPQLIQLMSASYGRGQQPSPVPLTYNRGGASRVGQWMCTVYEGLRGSEKIVELCAAENPGIALAPADFVLVQQALDSVKGAISKDVLDAVPVYGSANSQGYVGFPVRRTTFVNGKPDLTVELAGIRRGAIPAESFALPTAPAVPPANTRGQ